MGPTVRSRDLKYCVRRRESHCKVKHTLEGAQQGIGGLVVGPAQVEGLHDLVVLRVERSDRMTNREDGAKEGLHTEDAAD